MSKVASRLFTFFIGVPLVIGIVIWPSYNHLPLHLLICFAATIGASELYDIFAVNHKLLPKKMIVTCTALIAIVAGLCAVLPALFDMKHPHGQEIITFVYILVLLVLLGVEVFTAPDFKDSLDKIACSVFTITYTGFLLTFISRMTVWQLNGTSITTPAISIMLLMVFFTDSIAWFFGVLLGKSTRGYVKASPNKSLVGFFGGILGAVAAGVLSYFVWKEFFEGGLVKLIITGVFIALSSIVGDLAESVFKRSAGVKDSGNVIPGRGGMLDSLDSIVMSAPIFYILFSIFFGPFN
ncbi:phosphatidate cytidylyltransferase [Treponema sp.]|uniref:phosphatidate cytidylyltransferase n=1 Tax=Treponema sp. TaxID=166 RepID=UPI00298DDBEF|nr:phosphatidate cytidylyltransferase [Treponema sp.]MCQ2241426.1 phosphatidate cytidylyltransferase [Treponema sp.]